MTRHGNRRSGADIYGSPRFDRDDYCRCLDIGFAEYLAEVRLNEERIRRTGRKLLN